MEYIYQSAKLYKLNGVYDNFEFDAKASRNSSKTNIRRSISK